MQIVILCGGKGTRMGKDLQGLPKALIPIGNKPIIWHIMKYYSCFGFNNFVLCLGYKGNEIEKYFRGQKEFNLRFVDTGVETNTGERMKLAGKYVDSEMFFATYGDGLSDVNLKTLLKFHNKHKRIATITAVRPRSTFGIVKIGSHTDIVNDFQEKPLLDHWINGGFFVFNKEIFKYIKRGDILEKESFSRMVEKKELAAFKHRGFWECMDTYKDNLRLNQLWEANDAPWVIWKGR